MAERITKRNEKGTYFDGLNDKAGTDGQGRIYGEAAEKLAYYEDLEEQGRLIILPNTGNHIRTLEKMANDAQAEINYYYEHSEDDNCIFNNADMKEREFEILQTVIAMVKAEK